MERITNDIQKLFEEARREITDFPLAEGELIICSFFEYPALVDLPFQMVIIQNPNKKMRFSSRTWDRTYDLIRWKEGIFNLDRLRILEKDFLLSDSQIRIVQANLDQIAYTTLPQSLEKEGAIVLDGAQWKLHISWNDLELSYEWKVPNEHFPIFLPLIKELMSIANQA